MSLLLLLLPLMLLLLLLMLLLLLLLSLFVFWYNNLQKPSSPRKTMRRANRRQRPPEVSPPTPTMIITSSFFKARRSGGPRPRRRRCPYMCSCAPHVSLLQRRTFLWRTGQIYGQPLPFVCHGPNGQAGVSWNWPLHRQPSIRKHTAQGKLHVGHRVCYVHMYVYRGWLASR
jgi:hypothetical protein